ncbi:MAG: HAD family hydrolase [Ignavibacteria bacterium]|nr:HAD family hydrolase [Ignavibacteria bacterium]
MNTGCKKNSTQQKDSNTTSISSDPLPSWNDTEHKKSIINFVEKVTKKDSPDFVPVAERIATFDNDGTLWPEKPMYFQMVFTFDRIKAMAPNHPEWKTKQPFKAVLEDDIKTVLESGAESIDNLVMTVSADYTTEEFSKIVKDWIDTAKYHGTGKLYTDMVFQPMLELLTYLRNNGFKTYIVSGGTSDFMRPWAEKVYGIPPEQTIGTSFKMKFEMRDGKPVIVQLPEIFLLDDKANKPIGIYQYIGRRPIASFGNSDGDLQMMQWTMGGSGLRFALFVHHTDAEREYAYDRESPLWLFDKALDEANAKGWTVVDMKKDWKIIYSYEKK